MAYAYNETRCDILQPGKDKSYDDESNEEEEEGKRNFSQGGKAVDFMSDFRGGAGSFYSEVLDNIFWYLCENKEDADKARCVPEIDAAKDDSGNCIKPSDTPCNGVDQCESRSNCLWKAPKNGEVRERKYTKEEGSGAEDYLTDPQDSGSYLRKTGIYLAVGLALAVLNILVWTIFVIGRWCCCCLKNHCCCRCCSSKPKEEGYKICCQVRMPIFFYIFFLACIVAASFGAYTGDADIEKAVDNTIVHARNGLYDTSSFLGDAYAPMDKISDLVDE